MELREFIEARLAEDELWALACSAPNSWRGEHRPIATGVHWTWAVGDNWEPYPIDPLEEYAGESAHDTSPCLVTVERWPYSDSTLKSAWKDFQHQAISRVDEIRSAEAGHIARHDPARVLREVEAKRRTLARHPPEEIWIGQEGYPPDHLWHRRMIRMDCSTCRSGTCWDDYDASCSAPDWPCAEVRDVAAPYSDHPDYDPAWAPEATA